MTKKRRFPRQQPSFISKSLSAELDEAARLIERKRAAEAREKLVDLNRRYPQREGVLALLANAAYDLHDMPTYQAACEGLLKIRRNDPDLTLGLAGAYMGNFRPVLALRTFLRFLGRWPDHPRAGEARRTVAGLESRIPEILADAGLSGEDGVEVMARHEEMGSLLEQGHYAQAQAVAEEILRRRPDFVPTLNNLSLTYSIEDRLGEAIATAQRVLAVDPDNFHALANLVRFYCLKGRTDEARQWAERLKGVKSERGDVWSKKAEALSFLGDEQGVLDVFEGAERAGPLRSSTADPLLYHLAAVAAMRLGREREARRHWNQALKLSPRLAIAQANLDDLHRPVGERHAPWSFDFANWVPRAVVDELAAHVQSAARRASDEATREATRRFLRQHPAVVSLVPVLLDRGDPVGREFALRLALMARTSELLAALKDFALSQRGPDAMRHQAAQAAMEAGLLEPGPMRLWIEGEWREMLLFGFEVHGEPTSQHPPAVEQQIEGAVVAGRRGDLAGAERLLKAVLEKMPEDPIALNNLAAMYAQQGHLEEAERLLRQVHERHPDYLFARASLARIHISRGEIEEAEALLKPLLSRRRLHFSEFASLCGAQIELLVAKGQTSGAHSWLGMWEEIYPDAPEIDYWRRVLGRWRRR